MPTELNCSATDALAARFAAARPFRHVVIDDFLTAPLADQLLGEFPPFERGNGLNEDGLPGLKSTVEKMASLGGSFVRLDELVRSATFLRWLSAVTGIPDLLYDPHYFGGGTHENRAGQDLDVHIDFNRHPVTGWHRRLNLIIYLNPLWRPEFGGSLELHSDPRRGDDQVTLIHPDFNRCVIFETTESSWHGFSRISFPPDCPQDSRRSVALYFYTVAAPETGCADPHSTVYVDRPLPERFRAGLTLDQHDVDELQSRWNRHLQHNQRLYRDLQSLQTQLERAVRQHSPVGLIVLGLRRLVGAGLRKLGWRSSLKKAERTEARPGRPPAVVSGTLCPICEQTAPQLAVGPVAPTKDERFHVDRFDLLECSACRTVYLDPRPSPEDLRRLYQDGIQFSESTYTEPARIAALLDYYSTCLQQHRLLPRSGARMLEVGAGLAWVARACKALDPEVRTIAQDVTSECADRCPWVDQYLLGEMAVAAAHGPYQLISMTHVIEHLLEPMQAIAALAQLLAPGGKLFITAPYRPRDWRSGDGLQAWLDYSYLHVPAHVSYLTRAWFELAAKRSNLQLLHWDPSHDHHQAFEAVLMRR